MHSVIVLIVPGQSGLSYGKGIKNFIPLFALVDTLTVRIAAKQANFL